MMTSVFSVATLKFEPFEYQVAHLLEWITEKRKTMTASKDDNKRKHIADSAEEEVEEASLKKQKTIADDGDENGDDGYDNDDDDNGNDDDSSSTDDYSSEPEEEEMNLPTGSEEELLI
jgi:hypothetical protein